jgi:hypothetical protein
MEDVFIKTLFNAWESKPFFVIILVIFKILVEIQFNLLIYEWDYKSNYWI